MMKTKKSKKMHEISSTNVCPQILTEPSITKRPRGRPRKNVVEVSCNQQPTPDTLRNRKNLGTDTKTWRTIKIPMDAYELTQSLLNMISEYGWHQAGCNGKTDTPTIGSVVSEAVRLLHARTSKKSLTSATLESSQTT